MFGKKMTAEERMIGKWLAIIFLGFPVVAFTFVLTLAVAMHHTSGSETSPSGFTSSSNSSSQGAVSGVQDSSSVYSPCNASDDTMARECYHMGRTPQHCA